MGYYDFEVLICAGAGLLHYSPKNNPGSFLFNNLSVFLVCMVWDGFCVLPWPTSLDQFQQLFCLRSLGSK